MTSEMQIDEKQMEEEAGNFFNQLQRLMSNEDCPPEPEYFFDAIEHTEHMKYQNRGETVDENVDHYALSLNASLNLRSSNNTSFLLGPPRKQSSSSSRDPSPSYGNTSITLTPPLLKKEKKKRRYVQNRRKDTGGTLPEKDLLLSKYPEDFWPGELYRSGDRCSPVLQSPTSPFSLSSPKLQGSVVKKLSGRRLQKPRMLFDDQETHSSDEMSNSKDRVHCDNLKRSHSGSLPTIVADICSVCNQAEWQNGHQNEGEALSTSNPVLNKNPIISSTIGMGSDNDFQVLRVPSIGTDTSSEHSVHSDKADEHPYSPPIFNNNESMFAFERHKFLPAQDLPAISEDHLADEKNETWHSANDDANDFDHSGGYVHRRSTSDYVCDAPFSDPPLPISDSPRCRSGRTSKSGMRVISGNPNVSGFEVHSNLKLEEHNDVNTSPNGGESCHYFSDFDAGRKTSNLVLHQDDGSKTLQLVETGSDYPELKALCPADLIDSITRDIPEQGGSRKVRILKRKTKLKRHKSSLKSVKATPISCAVDHISSSLIRHVDDQEDSGSAAEPVVLLRQSSNLLSRKRSVPDTKKKEKKLFPFFGSARIKETSNRNGLNLNGSQISSDRKRFSLAESIRSSNRNSIEGLPDVLRVLSSTSETDLRNGSSSSSSTLENSSWPQLQKRKWEDLELWEEDPSSWTERFPEIKLSTGEERRQNIIYEFYTTEKRHCQVIVFLQQVFYVGLLRHNILTVNEIKNLIPDVIDSLLDFHLSLLRRIRERIFEDHVVSTISDIVYEEFKGGENRTAAIKAYTDFCLAKDNSDHCYNDFMTKNSNFRLFCENLERFPMFKNRNFKSCFLLIIQRFTKYPSLIEQMIKYDGNSESKAISQKALVVVRNFALKVDRDLSCQLLNRRFEQIQNMIDKNSVGKVLGQKFTFDDLILDKSEFRKILSIGTVHWQGLNHQNFELTMLLFDDVIVFLQNKNSSLHFFAHKDHASVLPLHATLIREVPRSNMIMLVVVALQQTPDMYQLSFSSRNEMEQWISALTTAQKLAPKYVRLASRKLFVKDSTQRSAENDKETEEEKYNTQLDKWQDEMDSIFLKQMNHESKLAEYIEERMLFLDQVRKHLSGFPLRPHLESHSAIPSSSTAKSRDLRELNKMKTILNSHFFDLRSVRRSQLDKLIEYAQKSRDSDLTSFFDDLHEISHPNNGDSATLSSSSDDSRPSTSRPRRVRTWNMGNLQDHQNDIIRRHTTVPKVHQQTSTSVAGDQQDSLDQQIGERLRKLSLSANSKARRAATELIRENVSLRLENDRLRSENALHRIHLAALRSKKTAFETTEKLEALRQKKEEVQSKELAFKKEYEKRLKELEAREQELNQKETELTEKENLSFELSDLDSVNSSGISRDTSFRSGAVIFNPSSTIPIQTSRSNVDISVPKHLASETKGKRAKK